jgi:hypothetical protein
MKRIAAAAVLLLVVPALASGQDAAHHYPAEGYAFLGLGGPASPPYLVEHMGLGGEVFLYKGLALAGEAGYARWGHACAVGCVDRRAVLSADFAYNFRLAGRAARFEPFLIGGYTAMGNHGVGSSANNGAGVNVWVMRRIGVRLEFRVYTASELTPKIQGEYVEFRMAFTLR